MFKFLKISEVVEGYGFNGVLFFVGDFLVLRILVVESVGFWFYDVDVGLRREVRVFVDNSFKFYVV